MSLDASEHRRYKVHNVEFWSTLETRIYTWLDIHVPLQVMDKFAIFSPGYGRLWHVE